MDLSSLEIFRTVAYEGSMSRAAQTLNFVQSNVTTKIKQLETELQTQLFYRNSRGVTLTSAGKTLLSYAEKIMHLLEEARKAVLDTSHPKGPLTIGAMETTAAVRLPSILAAYHKQYPEVGLSLLTGPTDQLVQSVLQYELDGAFVAGPIEHPEIIQEAFIEEELVLVSDSFKSFSEIIQEVRYRTILVFRSGCSYRAKLEQWLRAEGLLPVKVMEFGTLEGILGCVMAGFGISLLPKSVVEKSVFNGSIACHSIPEKYGKVRTVFIRRRDYYKTSALDKFLEMVRLGWG
ncbi:glutamate biosynthesis transcriptional regulator GltR [Bacillaceae bacterium]